jgi:GT2 family glycosyltransferase
MLRHLDRGSQEIDNGEYSNFEYVFGATAAAALYRREMIDDVSIDGEFFDSDFFVYREDADVAWRAQLLGWRCLYTPNPRAYHVRNVLPGNRRALPAEINMHSVKNRFLMRIKNMTADLYKRHWFWITFRDAVVVACCFTRETSSLRAFPAIVKSWRRVWAKRESRYAAAPGDRRVHRELVPGGARGSSGAEADPGPGAIAAAYSPRLARCALRLLAPAACRPTTEGSRPSPRS